MEVSHEFYVLGDSVPVVTGLATFLRVGNSWFLCDGTNLCLPIRPIRVSSITVNLAKGGKVSLGQPFVGKMCT